ncbi:MAG: PH domain-containing protein [Propionibacteriaceae bacterium]|nr:PH domain-containing protein [Propionibacteriaceae bacterium]
MAQPPLDPPRKIVVRRGPSFTAPTADPHPTHDLAEPALDRGDHPAVDTEEPAVTLAKEVERPHPLTGIARSWIALFGLVVVFGRDVAERGFASIAEMGPFSWIVGGLVLAVVIFNLVWGIIEWRTTTFIADDEEFRIERDFLSRDSARISYAKIQSVDIERSLPARLLGLSSVTIDVGGAGGKRLEFLAKERAEVLRDHLLVRMRQLASSAPLPSDDGSPSETPPEAQAAHRVVSVAPFTLVKGVLVSSLLPWLLGAVALIGVSTWLDGGFSFALLGAAVFGLGGYLWSQIAGNWNFHLDRVTDGLHMTRGLLTTTSQSLKADRIQAVSIHQDYLQRLTGLYRVRVTVLGFHGGESSGQTSGMVLPYGTRDDVTRVLAAFWPGINLDAIPLHGQPARARWLTPLGFHRHLWGADDQTVIAHHGWLEHTISLVPHRRMQSIGISQGPLQRKLGVASVNLHTTDGPVSLSLYHLDSSDARRFLDDQRSRALIARNDPSEPGYLAVLPAPLFDEPIHPA